jgi:hypothetical protein
MPDVHELIELETGFFTWARLVRCLRVYAAGAGDAESDRDQHATEHRALWSMYRILADHGAHYEAAHLAKIGAEIAVAGGDAALARKLRTASLSHLSRLRAPDRLRAQLTALGARVAALATRDAASAAPDLPDSTA